MKLSYFPQIDVLRFFAVMLVLMNHWLPDQWIHRLQLGRLGVELFFVISGFLITRILLSLKYTPISFASKLRIFYSRRILRIFPLYYVVILLTYMFHEGHFQDALSWNLLYGANFYMLKIGYFPGIMSHFWTLSVEEHFYLMWPLLILGSSARLTRVVILLAIGLGVFSRFCFFAFEFPPMYTNIFTSSCFDPLAIGGLLAYLKSKPVVFLNWMSQSKILLGLSMIGLAYSLYSFNLHGADNNPWNLIGIRLFAALCFFFFLQWAIQSQKAILHQKELVFLGKLSYSMYLLHNFVPGMLLGVPFPQSIHLRFFLYLLVLFLMSLLTWRLIETPFNLMKKRFSYSPDPVQWSNSETVKSNNSTPPGAP